MKKKKIVKEKAPKPRGGGTFTEAQYVSFIKSALRSASRRWPPISQCLKDAWVSRGVYHCAGCDQNVPVTIVVNGKRIKNVSVDHILPVIEIGFLNWDLFVSRLFCERDNLQVLCLECHSKKSILERKRI